MKLFIKFDLHKACQMLLEEQLAKQEIEYKILGFGEIQIANQLKSERLNELSKILKHYGIEVLENQKSILLQKIKDVIVDLVFKEDDLPSSKISHYLADELGYSYGYLSNLFSEYTYTSIENYIIIQKIERAKQLIGTNEFTFTEIAWKLNYSSVAHFSTQFKNTTGLTPSVFQKIINKRKETTTN